MGNYYIYILANEHNTTLYIGMTNDLVRRIYEHKCHLDRGSFTDQYNVTKLVYYEYCNHPESAIEREKQLKKKNRKAKEKLINRFNPSWKDLYDSILNG